MKKFYLFPIVVSTGLWTSFALAALQILVPNTSNYQPGTEPFHANWRGPSNLIESPRQENSVPPFMGDLPSFGEPSPGCVPSLSTDASNPNSNQSVCKSHQFDLGIQNQSSHPYFYFRKQDQKAGQASKPKTPLKSNLPPPS